MRGWRLLIGLLLAAAVMLTITVLHQPFKAILVVLVVAAAVARFWFLARRATDE
jgi:hypothetical protein